jgi:tetratricopeptide (TPR) repeat protein
MQPAEPEAHYLLGKCIEQAGHHKDALKYYKKAHILRPDNLTYVLAMVSVYRKSGRPSDAIALLKLTLQKNQQMSLLWGQLFESAVEAENLTIAHQALAKFCRLIRQEKTTEEQKKEFIAAGWHMIALDCWRISNYRDQLQLCVVLDEPWPAECVIEAAKKKFLDAPEVFVDFTRVISENAKIANSEQDLSCWNEIIKRLEYIRKQAEAQKLGST